MARISVIIPTYNRSSLLTRAVESAWAAGSDVEVLIIDNASTDNTPEICRKLKGIRYFRLSSNWGPAIARNVGIIQSASDYVAFLDDDDARLPGSLDLQLETLDANPNAGFSYGYSIVVDKELNPMGEKYPTQTVLGDIFWTLLGRNFIPTSSVIVKKQCFAFAGVFDRRFSPAEDWDMWIRLAEQFEAVTVEEPVTIYRQSNRKSSQFSSDQLVMLRAAARAQARGLKLPKAMRRSIGDREQLRRNFIHWASNILVWEAGEAIVEGSIGRALEIYRSAFSFNPIQAVRLYALKHLASCYLKSS